MARREQFGSAYEFINAKVRGMRSKLFESDRLFALAAARSLSELFRIMRPTDTFAGHLEFERDLAAEHVRQLDMVCRHLSGRMLELFQWLMAHYLLENIKVALRFYLTKGTPAQAESLMIPLPRQLEIKLDRLLEAPDLRGFAEALPVEELRRALASLLQPGEKPDQFTLDTALDSAYLKKLAALGPRMGGWIRRLTGFDVDSRNIMLLLRAKFSYGRDFEYVSRFLTPSRVYLNRLTAEKICSAADLGAAIDLIPQSCFAPGARGGLASLQQVEDALLFQQYRLAARCFVESVLEVAVVIGFYYIKRAELANLIRLTESIRHSLPHGEVASRLMVLER